MKRRLTVFIWRGRSGWGRFGGGVRPSLSPSPQSSSVVMASGKGIVPRSNLGVQPCPQNRMTSQTKGTVSTEAFSLSD